MELESADPDYLCWKSGNMEQVHPQELNSPVRLKMIYNNTGESPGLQAAWGLSVWIEQDGEVTLMDTGGDAAILMENLRNARLDPAKISTLVITHDHWDHKNGLKGLVGNPAFHAEIFVPEKVSKAYETEYPTARFRGISNPEEIAPGIWSTGSIETMYNGNPLYEQSLVLVRSNMLFLLTGCSHPGISHIVQRVIELFPGKTLALVAGGFHMGSHKEEEVRLISADLRQQGVLKIAPSHCTGGEAISLFRKEWNYDFTEFNLGDELVIP